MKIEVEETIHKLLVSFVDDERLTLAQGERRSLSLWLSNTGTRPIKDVWMITGPEDEILLGVKDGPDISEICCLITFCTLTPESRHLGNL